MNEKMKVGEQQEEVDDSGFFAGERLYFPYAMCLQPFLPRASWEEAPRHLNCTSASLKQGNTSVSMTDMPVYLACNH